MELLLLVVGAMISGLVKWKNSRRRSARARKNRPVRYVSIFHEQRGG